MTVDREYTEPGGVCDCGLPSVSHEQTAILKGVVFPSYFGSKGE